MPPGHAHGGVPRTSRNAAGGGFGHWWVREWWWWPPRAPPSGRSGGTKGASLRLRNRAGNEAMTDSSRRAAHRLALRSLLAPLALCMILEACGQSSNPARIDVTVEMDAALTLDSVTIEATAQGKSPLKKEIPAAGTNSLKWSIVIQSPGTNLTVTLVADGIHQKDSIVRYLAYARISPGRTVSVRLTLGSRCSGSAAPVCKPGDTCSDGTCVTPPTFGSDGPDGGGSPDLGGANCTEGVAGIPANPCHEAETAS